MNHKHIFKTRTNSQNSKEEIIGFFDNINSLTISLMLSDELPVIDSVEYFYINGEHIAVISPMSKLVDKIKDDAKVSAYYQDGFGKHVKKLYANLNCFIIKSDYFSIQELSKTNHMIDKMIKHNATFLKFDFISATLVLSHDEIYDLDESLTPSFAKFAPNAKQRFENSRRVLMTYLDREVIFSVFIEDDTYYCLAKEDSFKMSHIKNGEICKIYDGKDNHFETVITIVQDKTAEIFNKLKSSNNSYFKENVGLVGLTFKNTNKEV